MSKTTAALFIILLIVIGIMLFVFFGFKQPPNLTSLKPFITNSASGSNTSLSLTTSTPTIQRGQTVTVAVLIHSPNPLPNLVQFELAYDPLALTIYHITPGTFFTNPTVALENIDPIAGRISYALACPDKHDCVDPTSPTIATITLSSSPSMAKNTTLLAFLAKTVVRTHTGKDILQKTNNLQLSVANTYFQYASSSAITTPGANYIRVH